MQRLAGAEWQAEHDQHHLLSMQLGQLHLEAAIVRLDVLGRDHGDRNVGAGHAALHGRPGPHAHVLRVHMGQIHTSGWTM